MTVVEVRGRGGQLIERLRSGQDSICIGRAFDNDIILEDEHVSPHHLKLSLLENGWRFEDLDSVNGTRFRRRTARNGVLHSGDELRVGHTTLCVYADDHAVAPAERLNDVEGRLASLARPYVWLTLMAATLACSAVSLFWNTVETFEPLTALSPMLTEILIILVVAALWALIGRVLKHKAHFLAHFSLWLGSVLLGIVATFVSEGLAYNAGSQLLEEMLDTGLSTAVLALTIWASLVLATHLQSRRRVYAALGAACLFSAISVATELQFEREFSSYPEYYGRVEGPLLRWARPSDQGRLLDELPELFERADAEI